MTKKNNKSKAFRITVLTFGTLLAIFFLLATVPKLIDPPMDSAQEVSTGDDWGEKVVIAMVLVYLIGYIIGWWKRLIGGIIILLAALLVTIPFVALQSNYGSLVFGIPQFVVGILYILLYRAEKRQYNKI